MNVQKVVETFQNLTNYSDAQTIMQLRHYMDMNMKCAVDAIPILEITTLEEGLAAVEHIVKETENPAVYRKLFQETSSNFLY